MTIVTCLPAFNVMSHWYARMPHRDHLQTCNGHRQASSALHEPCMSLVWASVNLWGSHSGELKHKVAGRARFLYVVRFAQGSQGVVLRTCRMGLFDWGGLERLGAEKMCFRSGAWLEELRKFWVFSRAWQGPEWKEWKERKLQNEERFCLSRNCGIVVCQERRKGKMMEKGERLEQIDVPSTKKQGVLSVCHMLQRTSQRDTKNTRGQRTHLNTVYSFQDILPFPLHHTSSCLARLYPP